MDIIAQIKEDEDLYTNTSLEANPSYADTMPRLLELLDYYSNSKFREGDNDASGWKKPFDNISDNPIAVCAKMTDIDVKDIKIRAEDGQDYWPSWIMGREFNYWAKTKRLGVLLNKTIYNYADKGHIVLKKVGDEILDVRFKNLMYDPQASTLEDSYFKMEKHKYSFNKLRKMKAWDQDKIEAVIREYKAKKKYEVEVYERHGEVEGDENNNFYIVAGKDIGLDSDKAVLYKTGLDKSVYKDARAFDVDGRLAGRGIREKTLEAQIAKNEIAYYFHKGLQWSSLHIFQTRNKTMASNLLSQIENGEIMQTISEIMPIATEERNLGAYSYADAKWDSHVQKRTFAYDEVSGQRLPSGTPATNATLQAQMAGGYFGLRQEDLGLFWTDVIEDWILPNFKKDFRGNHKVHIANLMGGEEAAEKYFGLLVNNRTNKRIREMMQKGYIPAPKEIEMLKATSAEVVRHSNLEIPDNIYQNLKYTVAVDITGERIDTAGKISVLQTIFQILGSNPSVLQDKRTRRVLYKMLDYMGINPMDIDTVEDMGVADTAQQQAQMGGSIAAPTQMNMQPVPVSQPV